MNIWRPRQDIRVIGIGLHWRGRKLLAAEVCDDAGSVKGVRPLGGAVDFGERWDEAVVREFREELGLAVEVTGAPAVMENIFVHEGKTGHEVVFIGEVILPPGSFEDRDELSFAEDNGVTGVARWYDLEELDSPGPALFPAGLKRLLGTRGA